MKCNCGFEGHESVFGRVRVHGSDCPYLTVSLYESEREQLINQGTQNIYVCPECGTLKVKLP